MSFSPENLARIYQGIPASIGGKLPEEILNRRPYEVVSAIADGLTYTEAAAKQILHRVLYVAMYMGHMKD